MNLNIFTWPYRKRYYLTHPWEWFRTLFRNIRAAFQRIRRGYCSYDVYDLDHWLLDILPPMLRDIANSEIGAYPGVEPFETPEKWKAWLLDLAARFEELQTDWAETRNEYEEEHSKALNGARVDLAKVNGCYVHYGEIPPELHAKWLARIQELNEEQQKATEEAFKIMSEHFYQLWL